MSENPAFDLQFKSIEAGIPPDYWAEFDEAAHAYFQETGRHVKLDFALKLLQ